MAGHKPAFCSLSLVTALCQVLLVMIDPVVLILLCSLIFGKVKAAGFTSLLPHTNNLDFCHVVDRIVAADP